MYELGRASWELLIPAGGWDGHWSDGGEGGDGHFLQSKRWLHSDLTYVLVCTLKSTTLMTLSEVNQNLLVTCASSSHVQTLKLSRNLQTDIKKLQTSRKYTLLEVH